MFTKFLEVVFFDLFFLFSLQISIIGLFLAGLEFRHKRVEGLETYLLVHQKFLYILDFGVSISHFCIVAKHSLLIWNFFGEN